MAGLAGGVSLVSSPVMAALRTCSEGSRWAPECLVETRFVVSSETVLQPYFRRKLAEAVGKEGDEVILEDDGVSDLTQSFEVADEISDLIRNGWIAKVRDELEIAIWYWRPAVSAPFQVHDVDDSGTTTFRETVRSSLEHVPEQLRPISPRLGTGPDARYVVRIENGRTFVALPSEFYGPQTEFLVCCGSSEFIYPRQSMDRGIGVSNAGINYARDLDRHMLVALVAQRS